MDVINTSKGIDMVTANQWLLIICLFVVLPFCHLVSAEIYKCQQPDGSIRFTDAVCKEGPTETLTLIINSPLDSSAERANIAAYQAKKYERQLKVSEPQIIFIGDTSTEERNARISEPKLQKGKKSKKKKARKKKNKKNKKKKNSNKKKENSAL